MAGNSSGNPTGFKSLLGLKATTVADGLAVMELAIGTLLAVGEATYLYMESIQEEQP